MTSNFSTWPPNPILCHSRNPLLGTQSSFSVPHWPTVQVARVFNVKLLNMSFGFPIIIVIFSQCSSKKTSPLCG
jgi:hypothetical protein